MDALDRDIAGLVLAGGSARRFGGTGKALKLLGGEPLIKHALRPLRGLQRIAINANADRAALAPFAATLLSDRLADSGPLAGIDAGLAWAAGLEPGVHWLASVAVDTPFLPDDLVRQLAGSSADADIVVAASHHDFSPVVALWRVTLAPRLAAALDSGLRKMTDFQDLVRTRTLVLSAAGIDPLFNVNTLESLAVAERMLTDLRG